MRTSHFLPLLLICTNVVFFSGCGVSGGGGNAPANFHPVKPMSANELPPASSPSNAGASLRIGQGQFFSFAMPQGWRIGEDGQYALTLVAPDNKALTLMVGNSGYPVNYAPGQFVYEKLMALRPENLQLSQPRQAQPVKGFQYAYQFDVSYAINGAPCRGSVKCHVQPAYDMCVMAMTAALSDASQWQGYSSWLPLVADQISATNGAAFGMRGIMQQNLQNSTAYAQAAKEYRDWSQRNWQGVTDDRNASVDRRNEQFRETIGGVQSYANPYSNTPVQLPTTYAHYWVDRQGNVIGTDDPNANPNTGGTGDWTQMEPVKR